MTKRFFSSNILFFLRTVRKLHTCNLYLYFYSIKIIIKRTKYMYIYHIHKLCVYIYIYFRALYEIEIICNVAILLFPF